MKITTGARNFIDIDAYAGIIAYAELLNLQGRDARAATNSVLNGSITPTVLSWQAPLAQHYKPAANDTFTIIDISNFEVLDTMVDVERVDEVLDHHPGFEQFWQDKIGDKAVIETVGAACTLVYEQWQKAGLFQKMSQTSARLLVCGLLDNTLNFGAHITTERDRQAYQTLLPIADLPRDWTKRYFGECQASMLADIKKAIDDDTKADPFPGWPDGVATGQLAIWDAKDLEPQLSAIAEHMATKSRFWFMNIISMHDKCSHILCDDPALQEFLTELLDVRFKHGRATANRMWLRKEMVKKALLREEGTDK